MPSPFPGMNPYLEHPEVWHDFHERFLPKAGEALDAQVGDNYLVRIDEHVYVEEYTDGEGRAWVARPDVAITHRGSDTQKVGAAVLDSPAQVVPLILDEIRECFVEIRDRQNRTLVTVIELLSPANKSGRDRDRYILKRDQILKSTAHLIEIDLLRGGERLPFERLPPCDYYAMVSRDQRRPVAGFWPLALRDPLPRIPVPLKAGDADVWLDLQLILHQVYDGAGYAKYIYENEITPPLAPDDAAWASQFVPRR